MKITTRYILIASALMFFASVIGGWFMLSFFSDHETTAFLDRLESRVVADTTKHDVIFNAARRSQRLAGGAFQRRLDAWRAREDLTARFKETFETKSDGTYRSRDQDFDGRLSSEGQWIYGLGAFIAPGVEEDLERQAHLLAAYDIVTRFGEGSQFWADNFYYFTPKDDVIIFAPQREDRLEFYRKNAPADFTFRDRQISQHVRPEINPERTMRCSGLVGAVYDSTQMRMSSGCQSPVDVETEHVGAFGVTFFLNGWLSEAIANPIEGMKPFIIQTDGEMIAHDDLVDRSGGVETAKQFAADIQADELVQAMSGTGEAQGILFFEPWNSYVAYAMFTGPSWYYVARVPKSTVRSIALSESAVFAGAGIFIALCLIVFSTVLLRKIIARPLEKLTALADRDVVDASAVEFTGTHRTDEIGSLSRSFQRRDERFKELVSNLDNQVQLRTAEFEEARDAAEKANNAKSSFLANMSHEIRTPLNGVVGMAQVLAKSNLCERDRQYVDIIKTSSFSLLDVINDVLDLSKIESGSLEFDEVVFSLDELVNATALPFEHRAKEKGLALYVNIDENARGSYQSDPAKIKQVLTNLIANSLKFTQVGSISISVSAEDIGADQRRLVFTVQDTGIGISDTGLGKLFQPFVQADSSTTRQFGGTGLGLAICKRIIEGLGGDISAQSELGRGSSFFFEIPLPIVEAESTEIAIFDDGVMRETLQGLCILVAEDQAPNRLVIEAMLGSSVGKLVFAKDGVEAVAAWRRGNIDLILMDIHMPGMDGVEATQKIRDIEATQRLQPVPIVALTANAFTEQAAQYRAVGMDDHLAKPVDIRALHEMILNCVNRRSKAA